MLFLLHIEEVRKSKGTILIHCMAGISRSVTLTIAYLMAHFGMSMQDAYQFVKDKRPAISPNLNFMGQLVEFEKELQEHPPSIKLDINEYLSSEEQKALSQKLMDKIIRTNSLSGIPIIESPNEKDHTDSCNAVIPSQPPFILKPLTSKGRKAKKVCEVQKESKPVTNSRSDCTTSIASLHITASQDNNVPSNAQDSLSTKNFKETAEQRSLISCPLSPMQLLERSKELIEEQF